MKVRLQDVVAGLSIAGLLLPEAVAYASIANLPLQAGVVGLFAGLLAYAAFGDSRFAIVSATSSSAAVLAAVTASMALGNAPLQVALAAALVILTGGLLCMAGAARLGALSNFIAKPVLRGFGFGLAIVIIAKEMPKVVGFHAATADFLPLIGDLFRHFSAWNLPSILVGAVALVTLFLFKRVRYVPGGLVVVALGIAASQWLALTAHGVALVGPIDLHLVRPGLPDLARDDWQRLTEVSFALLFVLYAESYSSIQGMALQHGDEISPNRNLFALGAANLTSGLFAGLPVGAGYSATSANAAAGAQSKWAGLVAAAAVLAITLLFLPKLALTPEPVLAAIVIQAVSGHLKPAALRPYFAWRRDRLVVLAAILAVLMLGILDGLLVAVGVSLIMALRGLSEAKVSSLGRLGGGHDFVNLATHADAVAVPGVLILRPETPLMFANADRMLAAVHREIVAADPAPHAIILNLEESFDIDGSSIEALQSLVTKCKATSTLLILARLKSAALEVLERALPDKTGGVILTNLSIDDAVDMVAAKRVPIA